MVREARRAGLAFDDEKLRTLNCCHDEAVTEADMRGDTLSSAMMIPTIEVDPGSPLPTSPASATGEAPPIGLHFPSVNKNGKSEISSVAPEDGGHHHSSKFHTHLRSAEVNGRIHDVLQLKNGIPALSVLSWNIMEYLPFRRMDLQKDGTWKSITWPLPKGETRDIPEHAVIHGSVIRRMEADPNYRPGNLIIGGGGRGIRRAPKEYGIGKWQVLREEGDPIGEVYVRAEPPARMKSENGAKPKDRESNRQQPMFIGDEK